MRTIRFVVASLLLFDALSSCNDFFSVNGGVKGDSIVTSDTVEPCRQQVREHSFSHTKKKASRTEYYSSQTGERDVLGRKKYVYCGDPMLDNLTRAAEKAAYCSKSMSKEHTYKYTNEFLRKGELCDLKCISCGKGAMSKELSRLFFRLSGLGDVNESELEESIKECRFPNLTKKVVYEKYIPALEKRRREEEDALVDY